MQQILQKQRNPLLINIVIKKNNTITVFDTITRKNVIEEYQNRGFIVIAIQY